jgi:hypothetical protein
MSGGDKAAGVNRNYWSGTTKSNNTTNAWNTNLSHGNTNNNAKTNANYVRCVRQPFGNGKSFLLVGSPKFLIVNFESLFYMKI